VELRWQSGVATSFGVYSSFTQSGVALLLASALQKVLDQLFFKTQFRL
jgi:hypothetical protein